MAVSVLCVCPAIGGDMRRQLGQPRPLLQIGLPLVPIEMLPRFSRCFDEKTRNKK